MPIFSLDKELVFPPAELAEPDGLLAIGGDLSVDRLLLAYRSGIFPWYEGEYIIWWSPNPRFILVPDNLYVSKSMQVFIRKTSLQFTINKNFRGVMEACKNSFRKDQDGTWISDEMISAYTKLHQLGIAHSAEAWQDNEMVAGLYGIRMGDLFFGESMFTNISNASKFTFIRYVQQLKSEGVMLIDCQVYTEHLESLGASMISRKDFLNILSQNLEAR